ncbi:MAG TPA: flavin reductase family protein [Bosea sp. (in: a-proteobacteria)]|jgi:flavin reductase (DIM6/NTAB) family NADH-FMN oxidoreductase RutF|uniref:flavin reductase family protein n=1 Tax=Bosea sp. (in: a-proteobacteria) TaxID=1871050 RepID=UPI002E155DF0|nr:flavin reductase family protein [Bosea sp. (in: a-proteobacteria)]
MTIVPLVTKASPTEPALRSRGGPRIARLASGPVPAREDVAAFRAALRHLAGGVSVITTGRGEDRTGLTATSVASLSAEPPTLMFGLNLASSSFPVLARHRSFAVNFLNAAQKQIADRFAGRGGEKGAARYAGASWSTGPSGSPLLDGALAALDCEVEELIERHSHAIVIGRVREIRLGGDDAALLYWRGDYERLGWMAEEASTALGLRSL